MVKFNSSVHDDAIPHLCSALGELNVVASRDGRRNHGIVENFDTKPAAL